MQEQLDKSKMKDRCRKCGRKPIRIFPHHSGRCAECYEKYARLVNLGWIIVGIGSLWATWKGLAWIIDYTQNSTMSAGTAFLSVAAGLSVIAFVLCAIAFYSDEELNSNISKIAITFAATLFGSAGMLVFSFVLSLFFS